MGERTAYLWLVVGALLVLAYVASASVVGTAIADPDGAGVIHFPLDTKIPKGQVITDSDISKITADVRENLQVNGGDLKSLRIVKEGPDQAGDDTLGGIAEFTGANPGTVVQAELPEEVRKRIATYFLGGGGGLTIPEIAAGVGVGVAGGVVGGLFASGELGGGRHHKKRTPTLTPTGPTPTPRHPRPTRTPTPTPTPKHGPPSRFH